MVEQNHPSYVTVTHGMRGYFAVMLAWNSDLDGFYEPLMTGLGSYDTAAKAEPEAKDWASAEGVEYRAPSS